MSGPLLYSNVPIASGNQIYLERSRIDQILEKAFDSRTIIVTAGAGYGKTHAVYSFLKKYEYLTVWMQLSGWDNEGSRFWENFTAAIRSISARSADRLAEMGFPETERQFERYLTIPQTLVIPSAKYVFVYDDFHLIQDKKVLRFMEHSIGMPFPNITSILISRNEPAITIAARGESIAARITEVDLKFTQEEMGEYFRIQNIRTSPQTAAAVYRDCEGWAFAIHLSGLFLKNALPRGGIAAGAGHGYVPQVMRSNIFKLIETEVMGPLTPSLRKFLVKLSLCDHLPRELPELIAKAESPENNLIDEMEKIGSFIHFDTYRNAYQIHHLFLEYLEKQQDTLAAEEKKTVYEKAAAWCVENNQKMDAISYYEKAENFSGIIALIFTLPLIVPTLMAKFILDMLDRNSQEFYEENQAIIIVRARILVSLGFFAEAAQELKSAIPLLEAALPTPLIHRLLLGCYITLGFIGLINSINTADYGFAGLFEKAATHAPLSGYVTRPPVSVLTISSYICRVGSSAKGGMEKYIETLTAIAPHAAVAMGGCMMGLDDLAKAELAFFRGDTAEAEKQAHIALLRAVEGMQYEIENQALFYLLRIYLGRGNYEEMRRILKEMEARLDQCYYLNRFIYHDVNMGWLCAQIGNTAQLAPWLKNDFEESDLNSMARGLEILVKAKSHFAEKRYPVALAALENWTDDAGAPVLGRVETKALESVCRYHLRDREGAFAALEQAYKLSEPNGFTMPFTELGKDMRTLAEAALKDKPPGLPVLWLEECRRNAAAYAKKLYIIAKLFDKGASENDGAKKTADVSAALSRREREVLSYLSQGLTREEIAAASNLSINTIKSNVRSIYNKLGAANRADAVRIAAELRILRETHNSTGTKGRRFPA
ncbi:hypothetical protein AGMMS49579_09610 [Spirochaetia bacterium]|nr:hypothetical protein AGMMS49579_09610 [Spirochaetia bacterium]